MKIFRGRGLQSATKQSFQRKEIVAKMIPKGSYSIFLNKREKEKVF